ncbi:MAG: GFA family protein [Alphaproteobacteria bacterium]
MRHRPLPHERAVEARGHLPLATCRHATGSPLPAFAIFASGDVAVTGTTAGFRTSPECDRRFCPTCGSPVYVDEGEEYSVHVGSLDEPDRVAPSYELWSVRRLSWLDEMATLKRYAHNRDDG